ncbi:chromosome segregation protein SMC [Rapidithrix thailandica]|uniref:Chromosome partition protein Smc n=1 Tax=Rapidithrix thailandica TaxID=413964 RepID=A0AAW9SEK4_9BACT
MLLQKLEVRGFKSFGDKVVFNFDEGVTAIVGPNGSGKSNVVDAIRWVLGEQSTKALRSDKMDNVIFNGTKNRKPLQMAEVSLTFKNTKNLLPTEYSEVTISRRYYRSGDGEYLLNGIACRLKDIQNLFMDTGIGSDSYAIIELKMVDEILNDQNNSRRHLFEEAAGISKFKKRKKETLKKLNDTDADLERVEDLIHEISKNMRSLERQAKQAERYLVLKEEYKKFSLSLALMSVASHIETLQSLAKKIETESDSKLKLDKQTAELDAQIEKEKTEIINKEKLLASRQKTLNEHVHKIRQYESENKIRNERLKLLTDRCHKLQFQVEEDQKSNERAKFSLESLGKERDQVEKMLNETELVLENLKKDYESQKQKNNQLKQQVAELNSRMKSKQDLVYQLKKSLEISHVQQSALRQELDRESTATHERTEDIAKFDEKLVVLEDTLTRKKSLLEEMEQRQVLVESQLEATEGALSTLRDELSQTSRSLDAKKNEYSLTKAMLDNLEGYPQAIRFLRQSTEWGKDSVLLSDIITCEEKYRVAIENYLEPYLNFYVVESELQAMAGVNMLSDAAKGKANFLILNHFKNYQTQSYRQFEDAIPAIEIVEYDEKYQFLVHYLLEEVYVVTQNQESLPQTKEATFITQNGKIIRKKYSVSGGSVGLFEGKKIGRAKNIEKLSEEIKQLEKRQAELEKLIEQKLTDMQRLKEELKRGEIETLKTEVSRINEEYITIKTKKEQFASLLEDQANKRETIFEQLEQLNETIRENTPKVAEEEETLLNLQDQYEEFSEELMRHNEETSSKSAVYNQQNILFHRQTNQLESLEKEISYKETAFERGTARLQNNQEEVKHTETEIRQLQESSGVNEEELIALYEEKESIEAGVNEAEKDYYNARGLITEVEQQVRSCQHRRQALDEVLLKMKEEVSQTRMEMASVKERVSVEFEVELETLELAEEYRETPMETLKEEVEKVKGKLDRMGPINHMAIEAYHEIKERHDFIIEQKDDLLKAKESLVQTINEIDQVARENFMKAFTEIRENFIEVFRSLFTEEDSCDLTLADPDDPLNSKIDIIARPKGKRPLTINQLSGGEKTLTATALLFSIYLIKPAPFCIFDEVDAPLDDANIDKFNKIIKKFSENSQFIIVTHNKRTMASTDIIYGVTMVEQGVTTVVPVDLRDVENQFES